MQCAKYPEQGRERAFAALKSTIHTCITVVVMTILCIGGNAYGQDTSAVAIDSIPIENAGTESDSIPKEAAKPTADTITIREDTTSDLVNDYSVLDIAANRGIYIQSEDKKLELRILGSIRARFNYSDEELDDRQVMNPYEVPTKAEINVPTYFAGLQQTRFGLEVTRKTESVGEVFMRIEADFNSNEDGLRLRHAYGTMGNFLVGQTWTLLNNAGYQPLIVSRRGPAGDIGERSPQIRYTRRFEDQSSLSLAFEYTPPDIKVPDTSDLKIVQAFPNLTSRYTISKDNLTLRLAGIASIITGRAGDGQVHRRLAWGGTAALRHDVGDGAIFASFTMGRAIAQYISVFKNEGQVVAYDPGDAEFKLLFSTSAYLAYEHNLPGNISASISVGMASIHNRKFQPDDAYDFGFNVLSNLFWEPVSGTRIGLEYALAYRQDFGGNHGSANRVSVLAYYDF